MRCYLLQGMGCYISREINASQANMQSKDLRRYPLCMIRRSIAGPGSMAACWKKRYFWDSLIFFRAPGSAQHLCKLQFSTLHDRALALTATFRLRIISVIPVVLRTFNKTLILFHSPRYFSVYCIALLCLYPAMAGNRNEIVATLSSSQSAY